MDDLAALLPNSTATRLLIVAGVTTLTFALSAFACDRLGHKIISPFLAAGAYLSGAFALLVWFGGLPIRPPLPNAMPGLRGQTLALRQRSAIIFLTDGSAGDLMPDRIQAGELLPILRQLGDREVEHR
jgi:hypothetical protein